MSLHGATESERGALVPVSRRWPLADLIAACRTYTERTGRRIFFEWTLIEGVNDSPTHAERLGALLGGLAAHVNLIPLNPTEAFVGAASTASTARDFSKRCELPASRAPSVSVAGLMSRRAAVSCAQNQGTREVPRRRPRDPPARLSGLRFLKFRFRGLDRFGGFRDVGFDVLHEFVRGRVFRRSAVTFARASRRFVISALSASSFFCASAISASTALLSGAGIGLRVRLRGELGDVLGGPAFHDTQIRQRLFECGDARVGDFGFKNVERL